MSHVAPASLLDPALLAGIGDLELVARTVVDGFLHGRHRSLRSGQSLDFAEHRQYQPGDDLRRIDWRVYGRTDRFYLKTFEAETNADFRIALDLSRSMDFGSGATTKFVVGRILLAALAWLARHQGDRVGYLPMGGELADAVPSSARNLPLLLQALSRAEPNGTISLGVALDRLAAVSGRPGMMAVVSDCYDTPTAIRRGVGLLRARGHDVMLFHLIDSAERDFPYEASDTFADLETGSRLALEPDQVRQAYREAFSTHRAEVERLVVSDGGSYLAVFTDQPLDAALRFWLEHRQNYVPIR